MAPESPTSTMSTPAASAARALGKSYAVTMTIGSPSRLSSARPGGAARRAAGAGGGGGGTDARRAEPLELGQPGERDRQAVGRGGDDGDLAGVGGHGSVLPGGGQQ